MEVYRPEGKEKETLLTLIVMSMLRKMGGSVKLSREELKAIEGDKAFSLAVGDDDSITVSEVSGSYVGEAVPDGVKYNN